MVETPTRWGPCPVGHICPLGSAYPEKCPIGTYNALAKKTLSTHCLPCDRGYYGETTGLSVSTCTGKCSAGFYCSYDSEAIGAVVHSPIDGILGNRCAVGNYCIEGAYEEEPCAAGTYNPNIGAKECLACPVGFYCDEGVTEPTICGKGHYCELGTSGTAYLDVDDFSTGSPGTPCDIGKYQPEEGHWYCLKCLPGYYCAA